MSKAEKASPFFKRPVITHTFEAKTFTAVLYDNSEKARGSPVLVGFPNIGLTPILTVNFLIESLELPLIGNIKAKDSPPVVVISTEGIPSGAIRIYGNDKLTVICSEMKVEGNMKHLVQAIIKIVHHLDSSMIWCVEGVGVEKVDKIEREEMQYLTSNAELGKELQTLGHKPFSDAMIAGVTGGLLAETAVSEEKFDTTVILVPTSALYPDALSSVIAIRLLSKIHNWDSDVSKL